MSRLLTPRLVPVALTAAVLAGCGSPPEPLPTAPPETHGGVPSSGPANPSFGATAPGLPTDGLPAGGLLTPVAPVPTYPPPTATPTTPTPTTPPSPTPSPAAKCTSGPSGAQVIAVIKGKPGIPNEKLEVHAGPYCSGSWHFTELEIAGKNADEVDPLLVVTTGQPTALALVEAGADVCSLRVQQDAPPGIRVRACGF